MRGFSYLNRRRDALAADETGGDHDPSVSFVEIGARRTDHGAEVLAGDQQSSLVDFAGGDVHELPAQPDGV